MEKERIIDRFDKYMSFRGLNDNEVTRDLGFSNGLLGKSRKPGRDLSRKAAEEILEHYRDLDRIWLLTGDSDMLKNINNESELEISLIRLLPISAYGGTLNNFIVSVKDSDCERVISPVKAADFAITVAGDSMAPEFPNGCQILIKKIDESAFLEWGKVYVLDTCNGTVIKILNKSDREGYVRCTSINPDQARYAAFDIPEAAIFGVYRVIFVMAIK